MNIVWATKCASYYYKPYYNRKQKKKPVDERVKVKRAFVQWEMERGERMIHQ